MRSKRWTNQYISLVDSRRDRIFPAETESEREATRRILSERSKEYDALYVELGSGSGGHLIEHARRKPQSLFIGFELRFKRVYRTIEKADTLSVPNLFMVQGDARVFDTVFPEASLAGVYINFPDPWDKRRWQKHRLISPELCTRVLRSLSPGGFLSHKTDHREYFRATVEHLRSRDDAKILQLTENLHELPEAAELVRTEFENLFISNGLSINYLLCQK
jgi:tRNA (guanine-N7-)-methyltransferase